MCSSAPTIQHSGRKRQEPPSVSNTYSCPRLPLTEWPNDWPRTELKQQNPYSNNTALRRCMSACAWRDTIPCQRLNLGQHAVHLLLRARTRSTLRTFNSWSRLSCIVASIAIECVHCSNYVHLNCCCAKKIYV